MYTDADIEMAELTARANAAAYLRDKGYCTHNGSIGPSEGLYYPQQFILNPGERMCSERTGGCNLIWNDEVWNGGTPDPTVWNPASLMAMRVRGRIKAIPNDDARHAAHLALIDGETGEGVSWFTGGFA